MAKIPIERNGGSRTIYSLRHCYAAMRLSHETSPLILGKQMGNSGWMHEYFYGLTIRSALVAQITKAEGARDSIKRDTAYLIG